MVKCMHPVNGLVADDCRNIANILRSLGERHYIFKATKQLSQ